MNIILQDLDRAIPYIVSLSKSRSHIRISTLFTDLRQKGYLSFFGDYPIIAQIVYTVALCDGTPYPKDIARAFRRSSELKEYARVNNILITSLAVKQKL